MIAPAPTTSPLAVDATAAGALVGISARSWRRLNAAGECPRPLHIGGSVRWDVSVIRRWIGAGCPSRAAFERFDHTSSEAAA